ncbi:hypothetical protein CERZMDRAFT_32929 [Cercospora zeae-maydis SCOH1-5]|uniref:Acyl-CoA thioesterase II n=1 Tax=Cercospora zeae-maydis SCOH1-5 TaxID=717836 RepID=A0A6A6FVA5_9PEZI|nr:hypothetical protein CERZMDRAFT_32929 [Cercospora zeae-maydis SCOH1-5]
MASPPSPLNIERLLELRRVGPDTFVTAESAWLPPGAPSIYGGTVIAHCILAAQAIVSSGSLIASFHATFVQGGRPNIPINYTVQTLQSDDPRQVCTVRALQEEQCIAIASVNFRHEQRPGLSQPSSPEDQSPTERQPGPVHGGGGAETCPYICTELDAVPNGRGGVHETKIFQWMKTRHTIMSNDVSVHLAAIAYMSDNYFLPTATRVHGLRWERDPEDVPSKLVVQGQSGDSIKMMVSLDHKIHFHHGSKPIRADDWVQTEMQSPWAGDGRALVSQRIFSGNGELIATVLQEVFVFWAGGPF